MKVLRHRFYGEVYEDVAVITVAFRWLVSTWVTRAIIVPDSPTVLHTVKNGDRHKWVVTDMAYLS